MGTPFLSRRRFTLLAGSAVSVPALRAQPGAPATSVVDRIVKELGGEAPPNSADGFKAGDPNGPVHGIATTAMATVDVLRQAVKAKTNLVLSYEPVFFSRADRPATPGGRGPGGLDPEDPVYKAKKKFIEDNGLIVYRFHDRWQAHRGNDMEIALAETLGWAKNRAKAGDVLYDIPPATAEQVVANIRKRLKLNGGLRAVGDRTAQVRRILLHPGAMTPAIMWTRYTEADLIVAGEVREWENTHFAADLFTAGEKHGLVTVGRVVSEDPGMRLCSTWIQSIFKEFPVQHFDAGDAYWRAV
ncbi:MAG TPA: Nif3-like dinuclear metal center hexameric protein [Bryobacteraceae bacterium]|nr:Nif3-like dinuclear metal center hexameric protein [Bryobacteraceae bacterium]